MLSLLRTAPGAGLVKCYHLLRRSAPPRERSGIKMIALTTLLIHHEIPIVK